MLLHNKLNPLNLKKKKLIYSSKHIHNTRALKFERLTCWLCSRDSSLTRSLCSGSNSP